MAASSMDRMSAQEKEIASILNSNPSDRQKIRNLLSEYLYADDEEEEIGCTASVSSESSDEDDYDYGDQDDRQIALESMQTTHLDLCVATENFDINQDDQDFQKINAFK